MLDVIFTKYKDTECYLPPGKNGHIVMKIKYCLLQEKVILSKKRKGKYNYKRDN